MKRQLLVIVVLMVVGTAGSTMAADLGRPSGPAPVYTKAPPMAPVSNWTGFYIGSNSGYSWGKVESDFTSPATRASSNSQNINGYLAGGQVGYNWQTSNWVWGLEADFQGTSQKETLTNIDRNPADLLACCGPGAPSVAAGGVITSTLSQKLQWFGTARARVGFLPDPRWLVYATGGFAYGRVKTDLISVDPDGDVTNASWSETRVGWSAGAGVESAISDNWAWRLEYLHLDLGSGGGTTSSALTLNGTPVVGGTLNINSKVTDDIIRSGLSYRFR